MAASARAAPAAGVALVGLLGLASAMGVGRFAFTPLLSLMQEAGTLSLPEGGTLARANYLGYLLGALVCMALALGPAPAPAVARSLGPGGRT